MKHFRQPELSTPPHSFECDDGKQLQYGELRWINGAYRCWQCGQEGSLEYGFCVDCEEL